MPDIYAVGDAVEVTHFVTGQKVLISLAGPANKQGALPLTISAAEAAAITALRARLF